MMDTPSEMLSNMLSIAASAHKNQYDKAGKPYFLHCMKVAQLLNSEDEELLCIALGHDLFEDTTWCGAMLRAEGFSDRVIGGIYDMTKQRGQSYDEYKKQVKSNPDAVRVKRADLTHNSDIRRIKDAGQKDFDRTMKYRAFYAELETVL